MRPPDYDDVKARGVVTGIYRPIYRITRAWPTGEASGFALISTGDELRLKIPQSFQLDSRNFEFFAN
ncbi:hypothetical protein QTL95_14690, partial [Rhizobium sp. S152]|uniref:hypothetical protein n=1 Tax=Rhizobium sp. S152 TaxID=3055038 RepID=UPI0025A9C76E